MARALFIIDIQNDFTEGGALGVDGGAAVAASVTAYLESVPGAYDVVVASRDWHDADNSNGGHFALTAAPDFVDTWPVHCVAGTPGADYHPALDTSLINIHVTKGQGRPAYSLFEGTTDAGMPIAGVLDDLGVDDIDVVGIATDYCVRASALDALASAAPGKPRRVRVLSDLVAGVAPLSSAAALDELRAAGIGVVDSATAPPEITAPAEAIAPAAHTRPTSPSHPIGATHE